MDVKQEMRERRVVDVLLPQFSHADESYSPLLGRAVNEIRLALRGDSSFSGSESSLSEVSSLRRDGITMQHFVSKSGTVRNGMSFCLCRDMGFCKFLRIYFAVLSAIGTEPIKCMCSWLTVVG